MTSSNAAADAAEKTRPAKVGEKITEKLAEKRRALGRGLESLLPGPRPVTPTAPLSAPKDGAAHIGSQSATAVAVPEMHADVSSAGRESVSRLPLNQIDDNPYQTRTVFDQDALQELSRSIQAQGVLQPIVVRPGKDGRFDLILGERRLRASRIAGLETIPVIVKRVSDQQAAEMTLVENLQRADLNCIEQAHAFSHLSTQFHLTQEEIGKRVGVSREQVSNYIRLLGLPHDVVLALQKGTLQYSHARTLLRLRDNTEIERVAKRVIDEKMSVAKLEELVSAIDIPRGPDTNGDGRARPIDPNVKAAQRSLETILGVKVRIRDRKGKGKIVIEYSTLEDFDRVVEMLEGKSRG
ncbi:MAG TPA: ParB/RepB/Spo0J family partition protein [Terriglobales bacterium]|nr:ParB/RepB/Spo0J family partition protein [Terriglobales bacterium]